MTCIHYALCKNVVICFVEIIAYYADQHVCLTYFFFIPIKQLTYKSITRGHIKQYY